MGKTLDESRFLPKLNSTSIGQMIGDDSSLLPKPIHQSKDQSDLRFTVNVQSANDPKAMTSIPVSVSYDAFNKDFEVEVSVKLRPISK
jgi:hypothetical protein